MTVREFYEEMKKMNKEDYEIHVQYRDDGGYYLGEDSNVSLGGLEIDDERKVVVI